MIPTLTAVFPSGTFAAGVPALLPGALAVLSVCLLAMLAVGGPALSLRDAGGVLGGLRDNITECILIVDGDDVYVFANRAAAGMLGVDRQKVIGRPVRDVEHAARMPLLLAIDVLRHGRRPVATGRFHVGTRMVVSEFSRLEDSEGRYAGLVALTRDTTEECEFCDHMVRTERMAVLGELAAALAHEINSPLGGVMESVRIIRRNKDDSEKIDRFLPLAQRGLEQIATIVKQMLRFSSPQEAPRTATILEDMVVQCVDFLGYRQAESGAEVDLDLSTERTVVQASGSLTQVLINLVNNAFDAVAGSGDGRIEVRTELLGASAEVMVQVVDNGPGIPSHLRARIFEPFFTTKASGRGTGLGLSISARIAAAHGGRIVVSDAEDGGTVMSLILPVGGASGKDNVEPEQ